MASDAERNKGEILAHGKIEELVVRRKGTTARWAIDAVNKEAGETLIKGLEQITGKSFKRPAESGRRSVSFSSSRWGGSNWQPKGPGPLGNPDEIDIDKPRNDPKLG